jgi:hypothetical protein
LLSKISNLSKGEIRFLSKAVMDGMLNVRLFIIKGEFMGFLIYLNLIPPLLNNYVSCKSRFSSYFAFCSKILYPHKVVYYLKRFENRENDVVIGSIYIRIFLPFFADVTEMLKSKNKFLRLAGFLIC